MKRGSKILLSLWIIILSACALATVPKPESFERKQIFPFPFAKTWASTVEVMADGEWPVESIEKDSGLITTEFVNTGSDVGNKYTDCPLGPRGVTGFSQRRGKLSILVKSISENDTSVRINTHFEAFKGGGSLLGGEAGWMLCNSTGLVEMDIFNKIKATLGN